MNANEQTVDIFKPYCRQRAELPSIGVWCYRWLAAWFEEWDLPEC
jgi:hypothetical protein